MRHLRDRWLLIISRIWEAFKIVFGPNDPPRLNSVTSFELQCNMIHRHSSRIFLHVRVHSTRFTDYVFVKYIDSTSNSCCSTSHLYEFRYATPSWDNRIESRPESACGTQVPCYAWKSEVCSCFRRRKWGKSQSDEHIVHRRWKVEVFGEEGGEGPTI